LGALPVLQKGRIASNHGTGKSQERVGGRDISKVNIFQNGERVARCTANIKETSASLPGLPLLRAFLLPIVGLERLQVFAHLNGQPLSSFFNNSEIEVFYTDSQTVHTVEPMFYLFGRSETFRGNTTVSAVILINFFGHDSFQILDVLPQFPKIYKELSRRF